MKLVPYNLPSQTFAAGGSVNVSLRDIPKRLFGKNCHLAKLTFHNVITPVGAVATQVQTQNMVYSLEIFDGRMSRFSGGGYNLLRMKERLHTGRTRIPDVDVDIADGTARYFDRVWHAGPPNFVNPLDFAIPAGDLENAEVRIGFGSVTQIGVTSATGSVRIVAWLALLDEIRVPPAYQWTTQTAGSSDIALNGRALYDVIALLNSGSYDAITAGDFGAATLDLGQGFIVPGVKVNDLAAAYQDDYASGQVTFQGEPEATSDDNAKMIASGALASATAECNPILWSGPNAKITKLPLAESSARLKWDGSQGSGLVVIGRILPQTPSIVASIGERAVKAIGKRDVPGQTKPKTVSKKDFKGTYGEFMPWQVKVAG